MTPEIKDCAPSQRQDAGPFPFEKVLQDELEYVAATRDLRGERESVDTRHTGPYQRALRSNLSGLAFSGGGIRSATFNLGVLQALADLGLLKRFDYLSTVSGGGYIGSWLTALIHRPYEAWALEQEEKRKALETKNREHPGEAGSVEARKAEEEREEREEPPSSVKKALLKVEEQLKTEGTTRIEHPSITFLRRFSNYLTPKVGFFSADAWTVGTTYLRNLILNLVVLISAFGFALLVPRWLGLWLHHPPDEARSWIWLVLAAGALLYSVIGVGSHFGSFMVRNGERRSHLTQDRVQKGIVFPFLVGAFLFTIWLFAGELPPPWWLGWLDFLEEWPTGVKWSLFGALIYGGGWVVGYAVSTIRSHRGVSEDMVVEWVRLIVSAFIAGALGGLGLWYLEDFLTKQGDASLWRALTWGPPLLLTLFVLVGFFQTGFAGRTIHDHQREWLSRLGAWILIYGAAWLVLFLASTTATATFFWAGAWLTGAAVTGWLGSTLAGLLAGRGIERPDVQVSKTRTFLASFAPFVFIVGLIVFLTVGLDWVVGRGGQTPGWVNLQAQQTEVRNLRSGLDSEMAVTREVARLALDETSWTTFLRLQHALMEGTETEVLRWMMLGLFLLFLGFGFRVDINEFSMHRLYRNRLVRAYLGASVEGSKRQAQVQPFTGFSNDDLLMARLAPKSPGQPLYAAPLHLINTTLNLVNGRELAWQERKGASFVISPLFSGFRTAEDGGEDGGDATDDHFGYRRTCGPECQEAKRRDPKKAGYGSYPKMLSLGSAFTISGAAASPNMGFRSSPALAFLLTVFNVRLGWWLGNPSHSETWTKSGPRFGPLHLLSEVFGLTSDRKEYVYLSDGGHFENLGIYELIKRRCRFIVVSDAGADPKTAFEDLGNAIRKCRTDLGIEIELHPLALRPSADTGFSDGHCAVGIVRYDQRHPGEGKGTILYLKTSMTGDESEDLHNYRRQHGEFPHQSTGDQWFDESQFESYRHLGHHVAMSALAEDVMAVRIASSKNKRVDGGLTDEFGLESLAHRLRQRWYPPSSKKSSFTRLAASMDEIFERARCDEDLDFLDEQFYPEWDSLLTGKPWTGQPVWLPKRASQRRAGFYFCNELIQLMENVYLDLDLENEHDHPDNRGWMNLFKHWSWSAMFRATWAIACPTFGKRFVDFCERKLGLEAYANLGITRFALNPRTGDELFPKEASLNFLEKNIVEEFHQSNPGRLTEVYVFAFKVGDLRASLDPSAAKLEKAIEFRCGFAALDRDGFIVAFRIQDHLRKMGLARKALGRLFAEKNHDLECAKLVNEKEEQKRDRAAILVPAGYCDEFSLENRDRFGALFRSVKQELTPTGSPASDGRG